MQTEAILEQWLRDFITQHGGIAGTVHVRAGEALVLRAALNIPPKVAEITRTIPKGKGMAGLAWERNATVATCNLKTDASGDVRPGARAVDAQAALAVPVRNPGGELRAVVGIAFMGERDFPESELQRFEALVEGLPPSDASSETA
ncbi:MAG TPA: GAF domain-containing protein [Polyangiaceae bacterium]|nr:GAF domain-containing protein [Polyangiaceae bacterium]